MAVISATPRKLARSMAKAKLGQEKVTGYNKERIGRNGRKMPSMFAQNWRELAKQATAPRAKGKTRGKKK